MSNFEIGRLLGKMWKNVPPEVKTHYKQKAAIAQEQFRREHPNYVYKTSRDKGRLRHRAGVLGLPRDAGPGAAEPIPGAGERVKGQI
jgi:hypothetical protein